MSQRLVRHVTMGGCGVATACLSILSLMAGCTGFKDLRGDGMRDSENWGQELREKQKSSASYGGVSTKANQIERNLGVR